MNTAIERLPEDFRESSFWKKLGRHAIKAGKAVVRKALTLYYCMMDSETPAWAKAVIVGALAYFVLPADLIPDFIPGGYVDDLATLATAFVTVETHVKEQHGASAEQTMRKWFGNL